ncbi:MAG: hypothetical protein IRZ28_13085 [Steroidobacteraceae bacterium]|nr:hypothetical protein [Steroidobacteraceae bacterium]
MVIRFTRAGFAHLAFALVLVCFSALVSRPARAGSDGEGAADLLLKVWPGVRDSREQVIEMEPEAPAAFANEEEQRVRTVVMPVQVSWLGSRVLYLEEFLHDDPTNMRRQVLLTLSPDAKDPRRVRAALYTFREPEKWRQLGFSPARAAMLRQSDLEHAPGCDLLFVREGEQFRGSTVGRSCRSGSGEARLHVEYRVVIGEDVYWYRRRLIRDGDDALVQEVMGYNWFQPYDARLFTCRVDWSATGKPADLHRLARVDLHDQGGRARFTAPDGRQFELTLHSEDWAFAAERDALILVLSDPSLPHPVASAWAGLEARQIGIDLGWMQVRCGPLAPETDELAF